MTGMVIESTRRHKPLTAPLRLPTEVTTVSTYREVKTIMGIGMSPREMERTHFTFSNGAWTTE